MAKEVLPLAKYTWTHPGSHQAHIHTCVHFITYGRAYGPANATGVPVIFDLDLSNHWAPPSKLCDEYTGLQKELADSFFSNRANDDEYYRALRNFEERLNQIRKLEQAGRCVACLVHCNIGRHRSVAMAERLAKEVGYRKGFRAECLHLDIDKGDRADAKEMSKEESTRGRSRSRHPIREPSEIRTSEASRRRSTTTAYAVSPPRDAPSHEQKVSWAGTRPVEPYLRQHETTGRLAAPREEEYEMRYRRLSS